MINTSSTPPLGAAASRPPPPSSLAHLPSPMNYLIVVFSSSPQVKTGQKTQCCQCPLCAPINLIVTLIIARGRCHHPRVAMPAFAVPPLPPAFTVSPSPPSPPLQIVDCCVGRWSSPPLSREAGTAVIIRAAPYALWRAVVVRVSPPRPLLRGSTSGLVLGGYKWPRLRRPYYKMLIVVLVAVLSFVKGGAF